MARRAPRRASSGSLKALWKGALKLSLINIPVQGFAATTSADVSFHQLHRTCHTRIQLKKWCPQCQVDLAPADIVKGYESAGKLVIVTEEEISALRPASTRTIDISDVVASDVVDPVYIERTYFLAPNGPAAAPSFAVLREALGGRAAIGRIALHGREYVVAVVARDRALVMFTLRTAGEVRAVESVPGLQLAAKAKPAEIALATQVLETFSSGRDLSAFTDHYQDALRRMLAAKDATPAPASTTTARPRKVVNLMDSLRESLAAAQTRTPARSRRRPARKSGRVLAHAPAKRSRAS